MPKVCRKKNLLSLMSNCLISTVFRPCCCHSRRHSSSMTSSIYKSGSDEISVPNSSNVETPVSNNGRYDPSLFFNHPPSYERFGNRPSVDLNNSPTNSSHQHSPTSGSVIPVCSCTPPDSELMTMTLVNNDQCQIKITTDSFGDATSLTSGQCVRGPSTSVGTRGSMVSAAGHSQGDSHSDSYYSTTSSRSRKGGAGGGGKGGNPELDKENVDFLSNGGRSLYQPPPPGRGTVTMEKQHAYSTANDGGFGVRRGSLTTSRSTEFSVCEQITEVDFLRLVEKPDGLDNGEWMATHMLAFFTQLNSLYLSLVGELCTTNTCPVMSGPGNQQYSWIDDKGKKIKCAAPQYVDLVMSTVEKSVRSEDSFPTKFGNEFPSQFDALLRKLSRYLWHVLAHLHVNHWSDFRRAGLEPQATAVALHFAAFVKRFNLLSDQTKELTSLNEMVVLLNRHLLSVNSIGATLCHNYSGSSGGGGVGTSNGIEVQVAHYAGNMSNSSSGQQGGGEVVNNGGQSNGEVDSGTTQRFLQQQHNGFMVAESGPGGSQSLPATPLIGQLTYHQQTDHHSNHHGISLSHGSAGEQRQMMQLPRQQVHNPSPFATTSPATHQSLQARSQLGYGGNNSGGVGGNTDCPVHHHRNTGSCGSEESAAARLHHTMQLDNGDNDVVMVQAPDSTNAFLVDSI